MKSIKNHLMFILPFMAILLGIEFYLVFDRTTDSYEEGLKEGYSMLVVAKKPMKLAELQALSEHISSAKPIERENIVSEVLKGVNKSNTKAILSSLPYFYSVGLDTYLHTSGLEQIKKNLQSSANIKKVETFSGSYGSSYKLFSFIKFTLKLFILFMGVVSLFLIIKQMEIWKYVHKERMKIMETFGAPLMLRSGVLFKVAIIDALIAALLTSIIFLYMKFQWVDSSGIDIMIKNQDKLFRWDDLLLLLGAALCIAIVAVYSVVFSNKGVHE